MTGFAVEIAVLSRKRCREGNIGTGILADGRRVIMGIRSPTAAYVGIWTSDGFPAACGSFLGSFIMGPLG